jgi:MFS family permease
VGRVLRWPLSGPAASQSQPGKFAGLNLDFWIFWAGQAISTLGSSFTQFALPLLIFRLTGSAVNLSLSVAASYLPTLFFGLLIGAWVDRLNRKRLMIVCNLLLALIVSSIPLLDALRHLSVEWIYGAQFAAATVRLFFGTAAVAAVVGLVPKERLVTANGRIQASYSAMSVVGPLLAGALAAVLPLGALLVADAVSYLVSAVALLLTQGSFDASDRPEERTSVRQDIAEGLRFQYDEPAPIGSARPFAGPRSDDGQRPGRVRHPAGHAARRSGDPAHRQHLPGLHGDWRSRLLHPPGLLLHRPGPCRALSSADR